ncbi:MAG: BatA domain-containing protein, partial [Lentisphaeria bacterium]|nr:BatA domain-containing protein [Lentisphaeria bacterium]
MTPIHSSYLIFLLLGLIPIIIYYLMRFRSLKVQWGADYVLQRALERLKKNLYWEQLVLITLRVLICVLIVLAFSRMVGKSDDKSISGTEIHRIIILDASYSMLAGDDSAWDRSLTAMNKLVGSWGKGEAWSLIIAGEEPEWVVENYRVGSPEDSLKKLKGLQVGEFSSSIPRALKQSFQRYPNNKMEVYIFADSQAVSWKDSESIEYPSNARVYWMKGKKAEGQNLAIQSVNLSNERCLIAHPNMLEVRLQNYSQDAVQDVEVECLLDGKFFARETASILGGQESVIRFPIVFEKAGSHYVTARIKHDVLGYDNSMS